MRQLRQQKQFRPFMRVCARAHMRSVPTDSAVGIGWSNCANTCNTTSGCHRSQIKISLTTTQGNAEKVGNHYEQVTPVTQFHWCCIVCRHPRTQPSQIKISLTTTQDNTKKTPQPIATPAALGRGRRDLQPVEKGAFTRHKSAMLIPIAKVAIKLARGREEIGNIERITNHTPLVKPLAQRILQFEIGCGRPGHDRRRLQTIALPQQATLHRPGSNTTKLSAEFVD